MLQKPRGTRDFLPEEMEQRRSIEQRMREVARRGGDRGAGSYKHSTPAAKRKGGVVWGGGRLEKKKKQQERCGR